MVSGETFTSEDEILELFHVLTVALSSLGTLYTSAFHITKRFLVINIDFYVNLR